MQNNNNHINENFVMENNKNNNSNTGSTIDDSINLEIGKNENHISNENSSMKFEDASSLNSRTIEGSKNELKLNSTEENLNDISLKNNNYNDNVIQNNKYNKSSPERSSTNYHNNNNNNNDNNNNTYIQNPKNNINLNKIEESKNNNKQKNKKDVMSNNVIKGKKLGNANNNNNKFKTRVNETNTIKQKSRSTDIYSKIKKEKVNSQTNASKKVYNKNRKMKKDTIANNDNSIKKANEINSKNSKLSKSSRNENSKKSNELLDNSSNNYNNNTDNNSDKSNDNDSIDNNSINSNDNNNDSDDDNNENNDINNKTDNINKNNNNNNYNNEINLEKRDKENNNSLSKGLTSDSVIKMCRKNKYIKSKLRAKGISLEEHEDLIRNILNDKVPKSTDDIEYIRVNNITEKETNSNQEIRNNKTSKKTKIMEEFQKINESNKHAVYDYIGLDKNENFYDYNDIIANIDSKDKFYKEIVIFDNIEKFKEMMNNELISRYKIKPHPNEEINVNKINDTVNCAFAIMGHNKERKKLVDDEKTVWHQQINEATNLYNRLIGLGIDVDKRVIMNAIVSPKDVLHLNKESSFIKNIHKIVEENRRKKLLAAKKLSKSKDNGLDRGKSSSNYEINYLNKFKNSKWNSVRSKVDCYNQLVCNSTIRNMVKYYVKKRKECRKEIKENNVIDVVPFISSFPRHYRIEPNDEWFETNFFYSDNYVNPYHNYSCLFIDDMGIFSCYNDYYL